MRNQSAAPAIQYNYLDPELTVLLAECERRVESIERLATERNLELLPQSFERDQDYSRQYDHRSFDSY